MTKHRTQYAAGPGLPQTADQRIRWLPFKNYSGETIPPFACMEVTISGSVDDVVNGEHVWRAFKPSGSSALVQNPSCIMFNDGLPVPGEATGRGTFDLPARGMVPCDLTFASHGGVNLGPQADSWLLGIGDAFNYVMTDLSEPLGEKTSSIADSDRFKAVWVNRSAFRVGHGGTVLLGGGSMFVQFAVDPGAHIRPAGSADIIDAIPYNVVGSPSTTEARDAGLVVVSTPFFGLRCTQAGIYLCGFCGSLTGVTSGSTQPPDAASLIVSMLVNSQQTGYYGRRRHQVEIDEYGNETHVGEENVSFQGRLNLEEDDIIGVANAGAYSFDLIYGYLWGNRIGPYLTP